ncbi:MAG: hypothetical protein WCK92_12655 [Bacteroidota bacterium]
MKKVTSIFMILFVFAVLTPGLLFAQNTEKKNTNQSEKVKKCDSLWYYGIDLSHVRVTDGAKISRSIKYSSVYPSAWVAFVEKELPPYTTVQPELQKKVFYYVQDEVQNHTQKVSPNFIIGTNYSFPVDTLIKAVKSYKLSRSSGIGLVIIPENFNKNYESASSWITFFDIGTRELLWTVKVTGACQHMGYTAHWGSGIVEGFKSFINSSY